MNTSLTTAIATSCLMSAVWLGMRVRRFLPEHHLSSDSKDTVKVAMGLVATMSALLLGLLVNSSKASYDTTRSQVMQVGARFALLDRILAIYGPPAAEVRTGLRALIEEATRRMWREGTDPSASAQADTGTGNAFLVAVLKLDAHTDVEVALKAQAVSLTLDIGQIRSLMMTESTTSVSTPLLIVVVLWLVVIFLGFSLIAPPNATANFALIASALCSAGAIFLIVELDRPFDGLLQISREPMLHALSQIGK